MKNIANGGESESDGKGEVNVKATSILSDNNATATIIELLLDDANNKSWVEEKQSTISKESN